MRNLVPPFFAPRKKKVLLSRIKNPLEQFAMYGREKGGNSVDLAYIYLPLHKLIDACICMKLLVGIDEKFAYLGLRFKVLSMPEGWKAVSGKYRIKIQRMATEQSNSFGKEIDPALNLWEDVWSMFENI